MIWDAYELARKCDKCQRNFGVEVFDIQYILLALNYISKWVEAIVIPTNDTKLMTTLAKYSVKHCITITYHPKASSQAKVSNRKTKQILENTVNPTRKKWSVRLDDALWTYRTAYCWECLLTIWFMQIFSINQ
ncbi:protein NYNRIN-like [Gossypium australe]|uniref:Protein NYNRIN-like n=1 Tax=Gossypium australe TaxID=47621 RepID=A0A5B6WTZ9_9ROSI|nr:protein NYNRIN-like [Gossypium australe]